MFPSNDGEENTVPLPRQVFTVAEMCAKYRISKNRVFDEMKAGRLLAKRVGHRVLIDRDDASTWWNALPNRRIA